MSLLDPRERIERGLATERQVTGREAHAPATLYEESWRDFVFAEVWTRPGLPRRARFLVAISSAATCGLADDQLDDFVRGALTTGELALAELREAALHLAAYAGWGHGGRLDRAVSRVAAELSLPAPSVPPICPEPWDPAERNQRGQDTFAEVMTFPAGPPATPYLEGVNNFVFGEVWNRPGLDETSRRWITLVGVCESGAEIPIASQIHAAMASGNCSPDEMLEFCLQYGTHASWPKASQVQSVVLTMIPKVRQGLPWNG